MLKEASSQEKLQMAVQISGKILQNSIYEPSP